MVQETDNTGGDAPAPAHGFCRTAEARRFRWYALLVVSLCFVAIFSRSYNPQRDISFDAYYHVAMADLASQTAFGRQFPWTQFSVWRDHFSDKELGFHLLLAGVRRWAGLCGHSGNPPFLPENALLIGLYLGVMVWSLRRLGVLRPEAFLLAAALLSPLFVYRLTEVRPHVLAIALVTLATVLFATWEARRLPWSALVLGWLLAYSYSNPHFVLAPAAVLAVLRWRELGRRAGYPALFAAAGIVAGLTLHPQAPNTFLIWKIQCLEVPWQAVFGGAEIDSPTELCRPVALHYAMHGAALLTAAATGLFLLRLRRRGPVPFALRYFTVLGALSAAAFPLSIRVVEYGLPFTVIAAALAVQHAWGQRPAAGHRHLFAAVLLLCVLQLPLHWRLLAGEGIGYPRDFAAWCRERFPAGTYIANLYWDDFPPLFFAMPDYVFTYGMDPMFSHAADPARYRQLYRISMAFAGFPAQPQLRQLLGTNLVYLSPRYQATARAMARRFQYPLVYQGRDGWCFDLDLPPFDHARSAPAAAGK